MCSISMDHLYACHPNLFFSGVIIHDYKKKWKKVSNLSLSLKCVGVDVKFLFTRQKKTVVPIQTYIKFVFMFRFK